MLHLHVFALGNGTIVLFLNLSTVRKHVQYIRLGLNDVRPSI